mgnify:FL=1
MTVIYSCDVCKIETKEVVIVMGASLGKSPYRHLCSKCWQKIEKFLEERIAKPKIVLKKSLITMD